MSLTGTKSRKSAAVLGQLGGGIGGALGPVGGAVGTAIGYGAGAIGGAVGGAAEAAKLKKQQSKLERKARQGAGAGDREQAMAEAMPTTQGALTAGLPPTAGGAFSGQTAGAALERQKAGQQQALAVVGKTQRADRQQELDENSKRWKELQRQLRGEEAQAQRQAGQSEAQLGKMLRQVAGSEGTSEWLDDIAGKKGARGLPGWRDKLISFIPEGMGTDQMTDDELLEMAKLVKSESAPQMSRRQLNRGIRAGNRVLGNKASDRPGLELEEFSQEEIDRYNG